MAQLVIAAAGAAIGGAIPGFGIAALGISGSGLGWAIGSVVGGLFAPKQKGEGPRLSDLTVSSSAYGTPIPYVIGTPRLAGQIIWASNKREIATTTEQGKGGGGSSFTSYTYEVDLLIMLADNQMQGISRIWSNGELIYTRLDSATDDSLFTSNETTAWSRLTFYGGDASQMPDPTYEAAVGADAVAYRGRTCVFIESLQLGSSGQLPNLTFEIYSSGTEVSTDSLTRLQTDFSGASSADQSQYAIGSGVLTGGTVEEGYYQIDINSTSTKDLAWTNAGLAKPINEPYTLEAFFEAIEVDGNPVSVTGFMNATMFLSAGLLLSINGYGGSVPNANEFYYSDTINGGHSYLAGTDFFDALPTVHHFAISIAANGEYSVYLDGVRLVGPVAGTNFSNSSGDVRIGGTNLGSQTVRLRFYGVRARREQVYSGASITPPADPAEWGPAYRDFTTAIVGTVSLSEAVSAICLRAGLTADQFDVTALASITQPLRAMAISQVTSARQVLDMLASAYFFEAVASDKIYFRPRGAAPAKTLSYQDLGMYGDGQDMPGPLVLTDGNELELPAQIALTYNNIDGDYQTDTQYSDRLLSSMQSTSTISLPLGLTAAEAKAMADAMLVDSVVSLLATTLHLGLAHSDLEPTDVVIATGDDGSTYRLRLVKREDTGGVSAFEAVLDDASVLTQAGITDGATVSQSVVLPVADSVWLLLDIGPLRDDDDAPGYYVAVSGGGSSAWRAAGVYDSPDDTTYDLRLSLSSQAVIGQATTALAAWQGGNVWDEVSTVTVEVDGQLASATAAEVIARRSTNAALLGNELVQFRTATLVSPGVYTLTGFLRGRRGTESAMVGHAIGDRFVLLGTAGVRFMALQVAQLGVLRYVKAVTAGQLLSAVTAKTITPLGGTLKPLAPVLASADRAASDTVLHWYRRTRLSTRITGPLPWSNRLGEAAEAYEVDVYADGTYTTLKRTLAATDSQVTYTAADQTTDFGAPQSTLYIEIFQISATVGRGTGLRATV